MENIVAKINGKPITRSELDSTMQVYAMQMHQKATDQLTVDQFQEIYEISIEKLIARELIFQAALAAGVVAAEEAVEQEKQKLIADYENEEKFYETLRRAGMTPEFYHRMVRQDLTVNLMTAEKLKEVADPSPQEVETIYNKYPEKMVEPERVRARHILVAGSGDEREPALQRINEIREKTTPANFSKMARENSDCPSAQAGGDLGYFGRGQMVASFEAAAFSQTKGEVGEPVETPYGFHLILVQDKTAQRNLPFAEAEVQIRNFLKEESGVKFLENWVKQLRSEADVEIVK